jgi:hypothetical protein
MAFRPLLSARNRLSLCYGNQVALAPGRGRPCGGAARRLRHSAEHRHQGAVSAVRGRPGRDRAELGTFRTRNQGFGTTRWLDKHQNSAVPKRRRDRQEPYRRGYKYITRRLSARDFPPADSGSQTGSQWRQTPSDARRHPATIVQVKWPIRRRPATPRDGKISPEKRKVDSSILSLTTTDRHG